MTWETRASSDVSGEERKRAIGESQDGQRSRCLMTRWKDALSGYFTSSKLTSSKRPTATSIAASSAKKRRITTPSAADSPHWYQPEAERDTVLYLAYGSNLAFEKFQNQRGIQPLSQVNVVVPELTLTFDLPGIPYSEPCFSNTALRDPDQDLANRDYHKDRWRKGLVGVVYEVTREDYAHIIATEGGGAAYNDVFVACHPLNDGESTVPEHPSTKAFSAHTLFAPAAGETKGRLARPDTSYAQASARYLKFFTDGADEHSLPEEYKEYLDGLRPYRITTTRQQIGSKLFLGIWLPFFLILLQLQERLVDENGKGPAWLAWLFNAMVTAAWKSYDSVFLPMFGDGERSIPDGGKQPIGSRKSAKRPDEETGSKEAKVEQG